MGKGALHIHSTYSDGEFTLAELREVFLAAGCDFACVTDHVEYFDAEKVREYAEECAALSDERFCLIAGLEYSCLGRIHILGYGFTALLDTIEPEEVIQRIGAGGGIAVIAHPRDAAFEWIETFRVSPDGIETWNSKYDGRYAPRPGTFQLLQRLQQRRPTMCAFYGQDLHWRHQCRDLLTIVRAVVSNREAILAALARGDFCGSKDEFELPSTGKLPEAMLEKFATLHKRASLLRGWMKHCKDMAERWGLSIPARLKSQLRRLL